MIMFLPYQNKMFWQYQNKTAEVICFSPFPKKISSKLTYSSGTFWHWWNNMSQWNTVLFTMFFLPLILGKGKNTSKGLATMTQQILQPYIYRCLEVLEIKVFLATYIFNSPSKNNPISFLNCFLGEDDCKKVCHSPFFAIVRAQE